MVSFFPDVRVREVTAEELMGLDPEALSFCNLNTPEEFADAAERLDKAPK